MSREKIPISAAPVAARIAAGGLEQASERMFTESARSAREAGIREGEERAMQAAAGNLAQAAERYEVARAKAIAEIAPVAVELALEIARQLLRRELPEGRYDLEAIVREALAGLGRGPCVVHVHPEDAARLRDAKFRSGTVIEPDSGISRGSVHVATPQGLLVRDIDEALRSIGERLAAELRRVGGGP